MDVLSRDLSLRFWNFFNKDPRHWLPAGVGVTFSITTTITNRESHAHLAFVDVVAVPLNISDADVDFYQFLYTCAQYRLLEGDLNIQHRWKWNTSVCSSCYSCRFLEHQSSKHGEMCQRSFWRTHSPVKMITHHGLLILYVKEAFYSFERIK